MSTVELSARAKYRVNPNPTALKGRLVQNLRMRGQPTAPRLCRLMLIGLLPPFPRLTLISLRPNPWGMPVASMPWTVDSLDIASVPGAQVIHPAGPPRSNGSPPDFSKLALDVTSKRPFCCQGDHLRLIGRSARGATQGVSTVPCSAAVCACDDAAQRAGFMQLGRIGDCECHPGRLAVGEAGRSFFHALNLSFFLSSRNS